MASRCTSEMETSANDNHSELLIHIYILSFSIPPSVINDLFILPDPFVPSRHIFFESTTISAKEARKEEQSYNCICHWSTFFVSSSLKKLLVYRTHLMTELYAQIISHPSPFRCFGRLQLHHIWFSYSYIETLFLPSAYPTRPSSAHGHWHYSIFNHTVFHLHE